MLLLKASGAAIAAAERKHLSVDAACKAVPDRLQPLFAFLSCSAFGGSFFSRGAAGLSDHRQASDTPQSLRVRSYRTGPFAWRSPSAGSVRAAR